MACRPSIAPAVPPSVSRCTLPRSEDANADIALLGQVYQTLSKYEGPDSFSVTVQNGPQRVELDFPNNATRYCPALVQALEGLIGRGRLDVAAPMAPERPKWEKKRT